jgi:hypothetical protein
MNDEERARLHAIIRAEFAKHRWGTFVDEPPKGGRPCGYLVGYARISNLGHVPRRLHLAQNLRFGIDSIPEG